MHKTSVAMSLLLAGCVANGVVDPFQTESIYWPEAPDTRRIAFVADFSNSSDLGIRESVWTRLVSLATGPQNSDMVRPMAVAASANSRVIFVADPDAGCVHRYNLRDNNYACLAVGREADLVSPVGLVLADDETLYVSDSRSGRIYYATIDDKWLEPLELDSALEQPTGIAWDSSHRLLFVTDTGSQTIKAFEAGGVLVREFGGRGAMSGQFNFPTYLWFDSHDELLVTDSLNFRIQRFGDAGEFVHEFGENGDRVGYFARPKGVATDSHGHVYIIDALLNAIQVFSREGEFLIAIGRQGHAPGEFWLPNGIFISDDNMIYVADSHNKRVQVFRYVGPGQ